MIPTVDEGPGLAGPALGIAVDRTAQDFQADFYLQPVSDFEALPQKVCRQVGDKVSETVDVYDFSFQGSLLENGFWNPDGFRVFNAAPHFREGGSFGDPSRSGSEDIASVKGGRNIF